MKAQERGKKKQQRVQAGTCPPQATSTGSSAFSSSTAGVDPISLQVQTAPQHHALAQQAAGDSSCPEHRPTAVPLASSD